MPTVTSRFSTHISRVTDGCEKEIAMGPITVCEKGSLQKKGYSTVSFSKDVFSQGAVI